MMGSVISGVRPDTAKLSTGTPRILVLNGEQSPSGPDAVWQIDEEKPRKPIAYQSQTNCLSDMRRRLEDQARQ
jgi:hypothetical protein